MAKARMLHKTISTSLQVNKLSLPARLLFTWMIPHADDDGKMRGDPQYIKGTVVPMTKWSSKKVENYLEEISALGFIFWWVNPNTNEWFVEFVNWKKYQQIKSDRYKPSDLPSFNEENGTTMEPNEGQDGTATIPQSNVSESNQIESNKSEYVADKNIRRLIHPREFEPQNDDDLAALEAWEELEPNNQFAFMPTYLGALKKGVPGQVIRMFVSEIKQSPSVESKGKVFNAKVKEYLDKKVNFGKL